MRPIGTDRAPANSTSLKNSPNNMSAFIFVLAAVLIVVSPKLGGSQQKIAVFGFLLLTISNVSYHIVINW
jgi:hypothetical protein